MPTLKELLGEKFTPELAAAMGKDADKSFLLDDGTHIPKVNAEGEAKRLREELAAEKIKTKNLETANLSAEQKAAQEVAEAIANAKSAESISKKLTAKLSLQSKLAPTGIPIDETVLDLFAGDNPETAVKIADELAKVLAAAKAAGVAEANKTHLDNNSPPGGAGKPPATKEEFKKMTLDERMKLAQETPELYASLKGG